MAISPCPNDTFIFGNWIEGHLNELEASIHSELSCQFMDIQELNQEASKQKFDIIKVSSAHALQLLEHYQILRCGAAMGLNCGPLLIGKSEILESQIEDYEIVLPGIQTTASFLFEYCYPGLNKKRYQVFSEIENEVLKNDQTLGVIIHENRFTYQNKGLVCIKDLGKHWVDHTGMPIPLGLIMVKRRLPEIDKYHIKSQITLSLKKAMHSDKSIWSFIKKHATEMDDQVIKDHIQLYVNELSLDFGLIGELAILKLFELSGKNKIPSDLFI